jgi:hypothetical protein
MSDIHDEAVNAGLEAGSRHKPVPMIVGEEKTLFSNEIDYDKKVYYVESGVCGFAWVEIFPARGKFVSYLKKNDIGRVGDRGYRIPVFVFGQSLERKEKYAEAFASVLKKHGIKAYANSRVD